MNNKARHQQGVAEDNLKQKNCTLHNKKEETGKYVPKKAYSYS